MSMYLGRLQNSRYSAHPQLNSVVLFPCGAEYLSFLLPVGSYGLARKQLTASLLPFTLTIALVIGQYITGREKFTVLSFLTFCLLHCHIPCFDISTAHQIYCLSRSVPGPLAKCP